jgi:hypothetical protein
MIPCRLGSLSAVLVVDVVFGLFWLAVMAELAAYSDVSSPKDVGYYTTGPYGQSQQSSESNVAYDGIIGRLRRAWACGAAGAAFAGVEW